MLLMVLTCLECLRVRMRVGLHCCVVIVEMAEMVVMVVVPPWVMAVVVNLKCPWCGCFGHVE